MNKKTFWAIFSLGAILRLAYLGAANLWYDETFSAWISSLPLDRLFTAAAGDVHPPLYYLILWPLEHLGLTSEIALRMPSLLFSLAGIWVLWRIAVKLNWPAAAQLIGIGFMALSPVQIHFAQEARMYSLLQLELLVCLYAVLDRRWVLLCFWVLAALYTQYYTLFYLPALGLIGLAGEMVRPMHWAEVWPMAWQRDPRWTSKADCSQLRGLVLALGIPCILWLPWAVVLLHQMGAVAAGYWIQPVTPGAVVYDFYMFAWGFAMPDQWQPLAVMLTVGILALALIRLFQVRPAGWGPIALVSLLPIALAVIVSIAWKPILLFRGLLPSAPLLYLLVAWAMGRIPHRYQLYAGFLFVPVLVAGLISYYVYGPTNKGNTVELVNMVRDQWQPGDVIYHINDGSIVSWEWYGQDLPQYKMPHCENEPLGALTLQTRAGLGIVEIPLDQLNYKRAWIVWGDGPTTPACEEREADKLVDYASLFYTVRSDQFINSGIWLYGPKTIHQANR